MSFSNFNQKRFNKPIPIKEGEEYEVTIENIGEKGDGIAKIEGYVIIIPDTKKGEKVKIKVNAIRGKVSFGEVVEKLGEATAEELSEMENSDAKKTGEETSEEPVEDNSGGEEISEEESVEEPKEDSTDEETPKEDVVEESTEEKPEKTDDDSAEDASEESTENKSEDESAEEKKEE